MKFPKSILDLIIAWYIMRRVLRFAPQVVEDRTLRRLMDLWQLFLRLLM